ncbi:hypothetical protein Tco_0849613 [Tanacetum coccineum]
MGDENQPRTLLDYSRPSDEGYRNTIDLPEGNYVVPLRSDTIRLVQDGCAFHRLRSKNLNQHLKDFLKLVDSLDLSVENRERTTSDRRLIELENQVQHFMEAHLAPKPSVQVKKISSSCEVYNGPHVTKYCMDNPKQPFVNYSSLHSDEAGVSSARSNPMEDPQSSSNAFNLVNAIKTCFKSTNTFQKDQPQVKTLTVSEIETPKSKEPKKDLEDEFKDLHLNLPLLEVLSHAPVNVEVYVGKLKLVEDFYVIDMENDPTCPLLVGRGFLATASVVIDCKKTKIAVGEGITRSIFRVKEISLGHVDIPYWTTIAKRKSYELRLRTNDIGARPPYYLKNDFMDDHLLKELGIARDAELNPFKDVIVFRKMVEFLGAIPINIKGNMWESEDMIDKKIDWNKPPNEEDGAWHIRIELIDLDGEKFERIF